MPEIFSSLNFGVTGRAIKQNLVKINYYNPRDWSTKNFRQIDDKPYGGGPGMVIMYEPLSKAIQHAKSEMPSDCKVIYLSPQGKKIYQRDINVIAKNNIPTIFLAGRYEGIDERIITNHIDEEWSLGDFVLSGGEIAAMAFIDAITRILPGSLGHPASSVDDSYMNGLLDYPHYTRPAEVDGKKVPDVLINGNHRDIDRWRRKQSLGATWLKRPDLLKQILLSDVDNELINEFINEQNK
ncbi:MAG: tRNA (guanosine(37)-N1)-methyltransferase TrmD [Legionellales bacterium RIFCSPHIGHO2_12_FULL_35_11]|nr:MAG: tRNA (guanosine(37)-N1)-methyltransferase TrmD [Legionellales bacterium RIFCSPHIGHO2_12_FULL_35_11]